MFKNYQSTLVFLASFMLFSLILLAFWFQDWQYSLPTPKPKGLPLPETGQPLRLTSLPGIPASPDGRPLFLHFFNPACPCSRFNLDYIRGLVREHGAQVRFIAVIESGASCRNLHLPMPVVADADGAIARACGVYSTPQAVLLDTKGKLCYRGNYNAGRYCTERSTEFARLALEALLASRSPAVPSRAATMAYGCQLPSNPALPVASNSAFLRFCRRQIAHPGGLN